MLQRIQKFMKRNKYLSYCYIRKFNSRNYTKFMEPATKLITLVSIHFMILFTAFSAFQTILTRIHEEEGDRSLGPFTFAVNYISFMISNLFVSKTPYSQKWQIAFSTLTYALNYSTGFFMANKPTQVKYILAAIGATINGVGASFLWTSVGSYIHNVCHIYNKIEMKGHYYGLFNTIFCFSTVMGSIVVTFGLTIFQHNIYFIIVTSVALLAFVYGVIFIKDIKYKQKNEKTNQMNALARDGILSRALISAKSTLSFYPIMKFTLGLILLDGINLGVTTSTMLHLLPPVDDKTQNSFNAGSCLFVYGLGCVIGGFLGGKLCDKLRIKLSSTFSIFFFCISCLFSIAATQIFQIWSARLACFCWGWSLYFLSAALMVICSRLYQGKPETFALTKQFHSFVFVIYQIVAMATNNTLPVTGIMFVLLIFAIPAILGVHWSPEQSKSQLKHEEQQSKQSHIQSVLSVSNQPLLQQK